MREESAHDVSMAEARRNEAMQQLKEEKAKLKESEERNARLNAELHKLQASARTTSEPTLMVEVATLKAKNDELVDRLQRSDALHVACNRQHRERERARTAPGMQGAVNTCMYVYFACVCVCVCLCVCVI